MPLSHFERLAAAARASRVGEPDAGAGRDPRRRRRRSTRGCTRTRAIDGRSRRSWRPPSAARSTRPSRGRDRRRDAGRCASPTARPSSRPSSELPGGLRTLAQVALPGATRPPRVTGERRRPRRRCPHAAPTHRADARDPVWDAIATKRVVRRFADRPLEPAHLERILDAGRHAGSSKNQQRWTFIVCRDRAHLARAGGGRAVGRPPRRRRRRDRARHPGPGDRRRPAVDPVRSRSGGREHDAGRLGARDRQRAGDRLRARPGARRLLGYPADQHCEYLLSFGYPADPTDLTRPPSAGGRATLDEIVREERW